MSAHHSSSPALRNKCDCLNTSSSVSWQLVCFGKLFPHCCLIAAVHAFVYKVQPYKYEYQVADGTDYTAAGCSLCYLAVQRVNCRLHIAEQHGLQGSSWRSRSGMQPCVGPSLQPLPISSPIMSSSFDRYLHFLCVVQCCFGRPRS